MNIQHTLNHQRKPIQTRAKATNAKDGAKAQPENTEDRVTLGDSQKRVNWADVKELGTLGVLGTAIGATPLIGAGLGLFEISAATTFGDGISDCGRGIAGLACNLFGTASLAAGFIPGAVLGLGASGLIGAAAFVGDNMMGKTLFTDAPVEKRPVEQKSEFSAGRLLNSVGVGALTTAVGAIPGIGLLMGINAAGQSPGYGEERGGVPSVVGMGNLVRMGGAVTSVLTMNPLPYMVGVAASATALGVDNALLSYARD
jgi:hypothetical protein